MKRRVVLFVAIVGVLLALTALPATGDTSPTATADVETGVAASSQIDCSSCHSGEDIQDGPSPAMCQDCHPSAYEEWEDSGHAHSLEAAGGSVAENEECAACHVEEVAQTETFGRESVDTTGPKEPVTCEVCHDAPEDSWFAHFRAGPHGDQNPSVNYSAELCGACHNGEHHPQFEEWNEAGDSDFDASTMASHSEVTEGYAQSDSCVSCKSTQGGIVNLEAPGIYERNEEEQPAADAVTDWRISCAACHDPHPAELRIQDQATLCGNCHNTEHETLGPTGEEQEVHHAQWALYKDSKWRENGSHPELACSNCHMGQVPLTEEDGEVVEPAVTGHTFDFDAAVLTSDDQIEDSWRKCGNCHGDLGETVHLEEQQIEGAIEHAGTLKTAANQTLTDLELRDDEALMSAYHDGSFWLSYLEHTGSVIHNPEKATELAENSVTKFEEVQTKAYKVKLEEQSAEPQTKTTEEQTSETETPTPDEGTTTTESPGMGALVAVLSLMGAALLLRRHKR